MKIPESLIPWAENLDTQGSIRVDDAPKEMHLLYRLEFAEKVKRYGPTPPSPERTTKSARDLRPGEYLAIRNRSHCIQGVSEASIGQIPYPAILVNARNLRSLSYRMHDRVEITYGPILKAETWQEYQLKAEAKDYIELRQLAKRSEDDAPVGQSPEKAAEWLGDGRVQVNGTTISLELQKADVLQALVELRSATKPQLQKKSGVQDAVTVLRRLVHQFPTLALHIFFPGGRGKGGYRTTIINRADQTDH